MLRLFYRYIFEEGYGNVDPRGIEPLSPPCHGDILPVYYGPENYILPSVTIFSYTEIMEQHAIPRQITTFEFKLIGFLTIKQFIYLLIFIPIGLLIFYTFPIPILNFFL